MVLIAWSNSFSAGFVFDNGPLILKDPRVHEASWQNVGRIFSEGYWITRPGTALYRPLTSLSWLFNYAILGNGADPAGYHWINLLLHGANVTLVYFLALLIFEEASVALITAALWGVHPLLTESVTNIVGRADLLATFGILTGLLCFMKSVSNRPLLWAGLLMASFTVGLFSKESAVVLPALMLLLAWAKRAPWKKQAPAWIALAPPFVVWLVLRSRTHPHLEIPYFDNPLATAGFWDAKLTAIKVIGHYIVLFLWPEHLSADYSYNAIPLAGSALIAVVVLILCAGALYATFRYSRPAFFFLLFFFVTLAPVSNLVIPIGSIMAERFVYLPSIGLAGCFAVRLWALGKQPAWTIAVLICLAFVSRTYARNEDWHDDLSLWTADVQSVPDSAKAHANLANALMSMPDQLNHAIAEYRTALRIAPDFAEAHSNLGTALLQEPGHRDEAINEFQTALKLRPQYPDAQRNLGAVLSQDPARLTEAAEHLRAALTLEPDSAPTHFNLALVLSRMPGQTTETIAQLQTAIDLAPDMVDAHSALGDLLMRIPGRRDEAIAQYRIAAQLRPDDPGVSLRLSNALAH